MAPPAVGSCSKVFLNDIVPMDAIVLRQFDVYVSGPLVQGYVGERATGE